MIQEIYDYLLIRSNFMFDKDAILDAGKDKETFKHIIHNVVELMQKENFFLVYPETLENVNSLVHNYRFDYNKDKEINSDMNFIIERTNEYKNMSLKRKNYLVNEWLKNEFKDRNLPWICQTRENVTGAMMNEVSMFLMLCGYTLSEDGKSYEFDQSRQEQETTTDANRYFQIINLLSNRYPAFFYDEYNMKNALYNITSLAEDKPPVIVLNYAKRTLRNMKKLDKEIEEFDKEIVKQLRLK